MTREVEKTAILSIRNSTRVAWGSNFMPGFVHMLAESEADWLKEVPRKWKSEVDGKCDLGQDAQPCWGVCYEFRDRNDILEHTVCEGHKPILEDRPYLQRRVLS